MWPRTAEVALGLWLAMSPFVFGHPPDARALWWNDLASALLVVLLSLLSFWVRARRAHLANLAVALWLMVFGYLGSAAPAPGSAQNQLVVGLLLAMLAIIPSEASRPPVGWGELEAKRP